MQIEHIKLYQYRNYQALELYPHERLSVLVGENAQGKTNVLEAIYLCATGRSHRTPRDMQLISWNEEAAYVCLDVRRQEVLRRIEVRLAKNKGKQVKVDGSSILRMGELMGVFNAVLFSPEDLRLVKDGPSERRRFMDMEISQMSKPYFYALYQYVQALNQRNALMKMLQRNEGSVDALEVWDEQLVEYGAAVYIGRKQFIEELAVLAREHHARLSGRDEQLDIRYNSDVRAQSLEDAKVFFANMLVERREEDIRKGVTAHGVHRDDLFFELDGMEARVYASQGQQRSIALSLKISELHLMWKHVGEPPVFLLDDVMSELDGKRQQMLFEETRAFQTLLTCTHWPKEMQQKVSGDIYVTKQGKMSRMK